MACETNCVYGQCVSSVCSCEEGYTGTDCSIPFEYYIGIPYTIMNSISVFFHFVLLIYLIYIIFCLKKQKFNIKHIIIGLITFGIARKKIFIDLLIRFSEEY